MPQSWMHSTNIGLRGRQRRGKELFDGFSTFSIHLSLLGLTRKRLEGFCVMLTSIRIVTTFFQKSIKYFAKDLKFRKPRILRVLMPEMNCWTFSHLVVNISRKSGTNYHFDFFLASKSPNRDFTRGSTSWKHQGLKSWQLNEGSWWENGSEIQKSKSNVFTIWLWSTTIHDQEQKKQHCVREKVVRLAENFTVITITWILT